MNYIIKHDFKQDVPYYVRLIDNKTFDEIYNPKFATQFNSKKEAFFQYHKNWSPKREIMIIS